MEILAYILICVLSGYEIYNAYRIRKILRQRSEERTEARRAFYRDKAYKDLAYRRGLKNSRQMLWRSIQK